MDKQTVDLLLSAITDAVTFAAENRLKLIAIETVLAQQKPGLALSYEKEIANLKKQRAYAIDRSVLDSLRAKLLQG